MADSEIPDTKSEEPELIASEVDELTHAELLCMYQDSEANIRFSKLLQWRITGATLAVFALVVLLAIDHRNQGTMARILIILTCAIATAAISALAIFQSWQGIERAKVRMAVGNLSSLARKIYTTKPRQAANIERYILLFVMCSAILTAGFLVLSRLKGWFAV
ncbi:MAG: hypothetical protein HN478_11150 [Rhodospirillaceae bacterium]|jgi:hypothetical protein|nr:hypothetical protein [Rhodospirillaceae bacterium]MBT5046866.1 hypothetical protein [Rhodospirillaceae bacterium]MBT5455387.1 hypothetical protein [Rhodospirillaceae bacterium]